MPPQNPAPTLRVGPCQTIYGETVVLLYRLREHWHGYFADQTPKKNTEEWNLDGTHVENPAWNLKILEFDD